MEDVIFLQFYNYRYAPGTNSVVLQNGFSTAESVCKKYGDMVWLEGFEFIEDGSDLTVPDMVLPIDKGTVFVSCLNVINVFCVFELAKKYPNIKFVSGGPAFRCLSFSLIDDKPENVIFSTLTVEEYFNEPGGVWGLTLPDNKFEMPLFFSYFLDEDCYYGRCIFCSFNKSYHRSNEDPGFEFVDYIKNTDLHTIFLASPALTSCFIENHLSDLPDINTSYMTFIRPDKTTNESLKKGLNFKFKNATINFYIGIDFFSNAALKKIDKQLTVEDCFDTIDIILEKGFNVSATTILGWPFLSIEDVSEAKKWVDKYSDYNIRLVVNELQLKVNTKLHDMYDGSPNVFGPFYVGKQAVLNSKQDYLNTVVLEHMKEKMPEDLFTSRIGKFARQKNNY